MKGNLDQAVNVHNPFLQETFTLLPATAGTSMRVAVDLRSRALFPLVTKLLVIYGDKNWNIQNM